MFVINEMVIKMINKMLLRKHRDRIDRSKRRISVGFDGSYKSVNAYPWNRALADTCILLCVSFLFMHQLVSVNAADIKSTGEF